MRILIRNLDTGKFFKTTNEWTPQPWDAFDFQDEERALAAARDLGLKNLELHFTSDDGKTLFGSAIGPDS